VQQAPTAPDTDIAVNDIAALARGWQLSLRARNRSPKTVTGYLATLDLFRKFLVGAGMPTTVDRIGRDHIETFVADQLERWKPKTAQVRYGDLRQFFNWSVDEGEVAAHPMARMHPPTVPETPVPVVSDDDLRKLIATTKGDTFVNRRDAALLWLFIDCGLRLGEVTSLTIDAIDFDINVVLVMGKGRRPRNVPFSARTGQALDRYLRIRGKQPERNLPALWLGKKGAMTDSGIAQMLRRRCKDAGIAPIHPHQLRHTAAHSWLTAGGNEGDAMRLFGWKSRQMVNRYGASAADERARDAFKRISPADRL
jgi:site-specific recombinase XerD